MRGRAGLPGAFLRTHLSAKRSSKAESRSGIKPAETERFHPSDGAKCGIRGRWTGEKQVVLPIEDRISWSFAKHLAGRFAQNQEVVLKREVQLGIFHSKSSVLNLEPLKSLRVGSRIHQQVLDKRSVRRSHSELSWTHFNPNPNVVVTGTGR